MHGKNDGVSSSARIKHSCPISFKPDGIYIDDKRKLSAIGFNRFKTILQFPADQIRKK